jgi:hypothetical protein
MWSLNSLWTFIILEFHGLKYFLVRLLRFPLRTVVCSVCHHLLLSFTVYQPPSGVEYFFIKIRYKIWHRDFPPSYASFLLGPIQLSDICSNCHILVWVDQAQVDMTFRINIRNPMVPLPFYWILMTQGTIWIDLLWYQIETPLLENYIEYLAWVLNSASGTLKLQ